MRTPTPLPALLTAALALAAAIPTALSAQEEETASCGTLETHGVDDADADAARLAEIMGRAPSGPGFVRRWSDAPGVAVCGAVPWEARLRGEAPEDQASRERPSLRILPVRTRTVVNTGYPRDRNDGALWAGRGVSAALGGGVAVRWGAFSAAASPELLYSGNADYPVSTRGRERIDLPARIGTTDFALLDPGQSYARVDAFGAAAGVSTENLWLGPGLESSILLSPTAPGFPHAFAGTSRPVDVRIGRLEAEAFWGRLGESAFFDDDASNDHRTLAGLVVGFEPRGAPGLHLGAARLVQRASADDGRIGMTALYLRWILPESGFEVVGEWARQDAGGDFQELLADPGGGRTYLIGLQKVFDLGARWVRLRGEIANLNPTLSPDRTPTGGLYRDTAIVQGHTHRGQLLGAWTGPGSDYQVAGGDLLAEWGALGLFAQRVRRNVDIYFANDDLRRGYPLKHDVELTAGTRGTYFWRSLELDAVVAYSHRRNRDFLPLDIGELEQGYRVDANWSLEVGVTWRP